MHAQATTSDACWFESTADSNNDIIQTIAVFQSPLFWRDLHCHTVVTTLMIDRYHYTFSAVRPCYSITALHCMMSTARYSNPQHPRTVISTADVEDAVAAEVPAGENTLITAANQAAASPPVATTTPRPWPAEGTIISTAAGEGAVAAAVPAEDNTLTTTANQLLHNMRRTCGHHHAQALASRHGGGAERQALAVTQA
jgi:hypothetical protein